MAYLIYGVTLGLGAGISPGPLTALVIAASLRSGLAGGLRVAVAPLLTDLPIVTLALVVTNRLPSGVLRWVGVAGALLVAWLGMELLRSARSAQLPQPGVQQTNPDAELLRGVLVNFANPHPYLFWGTIGAPALLEAWAASPWRAAAFLVGFYSLLVGTKIGLTWGVTRAHGLLTARGYRIALALAGGSMLALAVSLLWQGISG
jgi:threonine/homoserine/homoserine lactone efflux protein